MFCFCAALTAGPDVPEIVATSGQMLDAGHRMTKSAQMVASIISSIQNPESAGISNGSSGNHLVGKLKFLHLKD